MDPTSNLREQRSLVSRMQVCEDNEHPNCSCLTDGLRLAELVQALDGWIEHGGFLPAPWARYWEARK